MNRQQYLDALERIGHRKVTIDQTPSGRYTVTCECGFQSEHKTSTKEAIKVAEQHRRQRLSVAFLDGSV